VVQDGFMWSCHVITEECRELANLTGLLVTTAGDSCRSNQPDPAVCRVFLWWC